ncbi:uncharacterized protein C16orf78 homolog [Dasypus novemcinctus]|uniref:uncharacterized protein C16orf78 homolog n=1 Tax=Dasypus novemcinctus TaxID=9361 RepID=UPI000328F7DD|nr:uncharacterized protein C16orf78 homolog [Dasypus novemcinctus]
MFPTQKHEQDSIMLEKPEDPKDVMPIGRKSMWKTAEERRMSDLTRVLEWMERRQGKKKQTQQKQKKPVKPFPKENVKEMKKVKGILKPQAGNRQTTARKSRKDGDPATHGRRYKSEKKGKRLSISPSNYTRKSDIDIKDVLTLESIQRSNSYRRQSFEPMLQDSFFSNRRSTLSREWVVKAPDSTYERKLKSLMEKGTEPKIESVRLLKPEEVLSCRYLRLSKNNIRTLLKLCKDAGLNVDVHPHMVEGEIDAKKVFTRNPSIAL